jgi:hypothetical protein
VSCRTLVLDTLLAATFALCAAGPSGALEFVRGHFYTTNYFERTIFEYDETGAIVDSLAVSADDADDLKGLAFGADGLLYVAAVVDRGFEVLVLDEDGVIHERYPGAVYVRGNLSFGKLVMDDRYLYVAGQNWLTRFELGDPGSATAIFSDNQIYDVDVLPGGNLLVLSAYRIHEITPDGTPIRQLGPSFPNQLTDARGLEYDDVTGRLFVTHLGHSGFFYRLMELDFATGALLDDTAFTYADDLFVTLSGDLLVGSRLETPRFYDQDLQQVGALEGPPRMFVTQYTLEDPTLEIAIDIKPGAFPNFLDALQGGAIPVAILGSESFDVFDVDLDSLTLGPDAAPREPTEKWKGVKAGPTDVNGDEWPDLLVAFQTAETGIALGDSEACVEGETLEGTPLRGCDAIQTLPDKACGLGFELTLLLPPVMALRRSARRRPRSPRRLR